MFQRGVPKTSMWVSRHAMPGRETTKFRARPHHGIHFIARISRADDIVWSSPLNKVDTILYRPAETESIALAASHRAPSSAIM